MNIGSEEMISINDLAHLVASAGKNSINNIPGPVGVRGRNSDNKLIYENFLGNRNMILRLVLKNLSMDFRKCRVSWVNYLY